MYLLPCSGLRSITTAVNEAPEYLSDCQKCGEVLDVSALSPFDKVECPLCSELTRVQYEFGRYVLQRVQGIGGMSMIYQAQDKVLERTVALKILNAEYCTDEKRMEEFEREAEVTAGLSHPHIVRVYTVGRAFGRFFIVMELVNGRSLEEMILQEGVVAESQVVTIAEQVIGGLRAAGESQMIHRDMKPGNILIDEYGRAKIVDFGLALQTNDGLAVAEEIWATPYYTAPEALTGAVEDFRSDMYALAASLYHALAGRPPTSEESRNPKILLKAKREIRSLAMVAPSISVTVASAIDKAMSWDPKDRFSSYEDFALALKGELKAGRGKRFWWGR